MYANNGNNDDLPAGSGAGYGSDLNDPAEPAKPNVDDLLPANFPADSNPPANNDDQTDTGSGSDDQSAPPDLADQPNDVAAGGGATGGNNDLLNIKQQALQQLSPLVDELDQSPEERFRTTMMMIQASDNKDLLQSAYDAAEQISDKKEKAQALLDVVNEINYFTQQPSADDSPAEA